MKKLMNYFLAISVLFSIFLLSGCDDEDWARYDNRSYNISQVITGNVFVPSEIENELLDIASEYIDNPIFVYAGYQFNENDNGIALFRLYDSVNRDGYSAYLDISVNLQDNTAYKATYEYGHSKRVSKETEPIIYKDKDAHDIYQRYIINAYETKGKIVDHISIKYSAVEIMVVFYDENNNFIDSFVDECIYD